MKHGFCVNVNFPYTIADYTNQKVQPSKAYTASRHRLLPHPLAQVHSGDISHGSILLTASFAGDSLGHYHSWEDFSTWDRDNDKDPDENCAEREHGAWWYHSCGLSNLNGRYLAVGGGAGTAYWEDSDGVLHSFRTIEMKIRPMHGQSA